MTQLNEHPQVRPTYRPRTAVELAAQQLAAIEQFHQARRAADEAVAAASLTREERLTRDRHQDVVRREHEAIIARCDQHLRGSVDLLLQSGARRVVLAHRHEWFIDKVASLLAAQGVHDVTRLENGADAVGAAIAEQPDLLLVEDSLAMVSGEQVVREVRLFSPETLVVAQVAYSDRVGALLDAGAAAVFTRQIPPADVVQGVLRLMTVSAV